MSQLDRPPSLTDSDCHQQQVAPLCILLPPSPLPSQPLPSPITSIFCFFDHSYQHHLLPSISHPISTLVLHRFVRTSSSHFFPSILSLFVFSSVDLYNLILVFFYGVSGQRSNRSDGKWVLKLETLARTVPLVCQSSFSLKFCKGVTINLSVIYWHKKRYKCISTFNIWGCCTHVLYLPLKREKHSIKRYIPQCHN